MRNSAWYHKIWRKKLANISVKKSADSSWGEMKKLLDQHMPIKAAPQVSSNTYFIKKLLKLMGFISPVIIIVCVIAYLNRPKLQEQNAAIKQIESFRQDSIDTDKIQNGPKNDGKLTESIPFKKTDRKLQEDDEIVNKRKNSEPILMSTNLSDRGADFGLAKKNWSIKKVIADSSSNSTSKFLQADVHQNLSRLALSKSLVEQQNKVTDKAMNELLSTKVILSKNILESSALDTSILRDRRTQKFVQQRNENTKSKQKKNKDLNKISRKQSKDVRVKKITNDLKSKITIVPYNYGLETGINLDTYRQSIYVGIFGSIALKKRWLIAIGLNANGSQNISGSFSHPSYFKADSLPPFIVSDTRKLTILDIPLKLEYRLTKNITVNGGTIISFPIKQSSIKTMLEPIADPRDTIYHSKEINSALNNTAANKINMGLTGGVKININRMYINGSYQWLNSHQIRNSLGFYDRKYQFFRIGIGYQFK